MTAIQLERELPTEQTIPCFKCGGPTVTKMDAIGRTYQRCARCDGVSPVRPRHPDETYLPQALVKVSGASLPPVAPGQLRCQQCAHGVEERERFCPSCLAQRSATQLLAHCLTCGATRPRAKGGHATLKRCAACPKEKGTRGNRVYHPKLCTCGATFLPTGPRAIRCEACR
jgi:hypothetical protein